MSVIHYSELVKLELVGFRTSIFSKETRGHARGPGHEKVDQKAKQGAESSELEVPLTLRRAKSMMTIYIDKRNASTQKTKSFVQPWETLVSVGLSQGPCTLSPNHTGHDFMGVHFHWIIVLAADEVYPLCSHARLDGDHQLQ
ncbi:uncharacterized protein TNCV_3052761 [Trichonephila clavipes]|nr:uncharacterized protein TNCV_3052761 [Trichonephila clavipes]